MFFRTKCPIGTWDKTWVEFKMQQFADSLGPDRMQSATVALPTKQFFPSDYEPTFEHAEIYKDTVAELMGVDPASCALVRRELESDDEEVDVMARYDRSNSPVIQLVESELADPIELVFTLAHALAQHVLLESNPEAADEPSYSQSVDLLTVFLGFGVFAANSPVRFNESSDIRHKFLTSQVIGYALALFGWQRDEIDQPWVSLLRPDAKESMLSGLKYLKKTSDSVFVLGEAADQRWTETAMVAALESDSPSDRLAAMWYLNRHSARSAGGEASPRPLSDEAVAATVGCIGHRDPAVRTSAAAILRRASATEEVIDALHQATKDSHEPVRQNAADTIGHLGAASDDLRESLVGLLSDPSDSVFYSAASSLTALEHSDDEIVGLILKRMKATLVNCQYGLAEEITRILAKQRGDFADCIQSYFADDEQLQRQAGEVLESIATNETA